MTHRFLPAMLAAVALLQACQTMAGASETAVEAEASRMLAAIGGREAWAALTNTVNDSQQNRAGKPPVIRSIITMDFDNPRFRIETIAPDFRLARAIDGDRHWRMDRNGKIEPLSDDFLAGEMSWYEGHVYRTIHRIAKRDPEITLKLGKDERLEVHQAGRRIAWFRLDSRGEPYRFGTHDDDVGAIFGPWDFEVRGIRHPMWVSSADGTWRAMVKSLELNVALDDETFAPPEAR